MRSFPFGGSLRRPRRRSSVPIWRAAVALAVAAASIAIVTDTASAGPGSTVQINISPSGAAGTDGAIPAISANGRIVVYVSGQSNLIPGVTGVHLYARDRATSTTTVVDVANDGTPSDRGNLSDFDVSADGRYVVFTSDSTVFDPLAEQPCIIEVYDSDEGEYDERPAPCREVYRRDLFAGTTELVSVALAGAADGYSASPRISGDGQTVAFSSAASNLVSGDVSDTWDIFVRHIDTDVTELVSVAQDGGFADAVSGGPDISANGTTVAFWSVASNIAPFNPAPYSDIFVRDLVAGSTESLLSTTLSSESFDPSVSGDGMVVSFITQEALLPGDGNGTWDLYILDRSTNVIESPTLDPAGFVTGSDRGQVSDDGRFVVFRSGLALVPGATFGRGHVYVYDRVLQSVSLEGVRSDGTEPNNGVDSGFSSISGDGRFVVFWTRSDDITPNDTPYSDDVFIHDRGAQPRSASGAGSATTDSEGDGATYLDPIEASVSGSPGTVSITELGPHDPAAAPVPGYTVLGQQLQITAAPAVAPGWLTLTFRLDASVIPVGLTATDITLARNGTALALCSGPTDSGPCVASRATLGDGDIELVAHSPEASIWAVVGPGTEPADTVPPTINLLSPANGAVVVKGTSLTADFSCADTGRSGLASCVGTVASGAPLSTTTVGTKTFTVTARDGAGNETVTTNTYRVVYAVSGFFGPVDNQPTVNAAKAGRAIPVMFSLGGDQGLAVLEPGYPLSRSVNCSSGAQVDTIETTTANASGLTYDSVSGRYTYVWKTPKSWASSGSCRELVLKFVDGSELRASFTFS